MFIKCTIKEKGKILDIKFSDSVISQEKKKLITNSQIRAAVIILMQPIQKEREDEAGTTFAIIPPAGSTRDRVRKWRCPPRLFADIARIRACCRNLSRYTTDLSSRA